MCICGLDIYMYVYKNQSYMRGSTNISLYKPTYFHTYEKSVTILHQDIRTYENICVYIHQNIYTYVKIYTYL